MFQNYGAMSCMMAYRYIVAIILFCFTHSRPQVPTLTVVIVVDQFAYRYLVDMKPYLKGGLKKLLEQGVVYKNAYVPHAMPATGTGHSALSTGTFATYHGIIGNHWFNVQGERVRCDDDTPERAAVFSPTGVYDYGKSARNLMVDGISDQFVISSTPKQRKASYAVSLKSRTAVLTANKCGKAIWFDAKGGRFTSSKAYFDQLHDWLNQFNKKHIPHKDATFFWRPTYALDGAAYQWHESESYTHVQHQKPIINTTISLKENGKVSYEIYEKTPYANQLLFDLASTVIETQLKQHDALLLWLDISSLDKLGHFYGSYSNEILDFIYHLDRQLETFITHVQRMVGKDKVLFALSADHGVSPMIPLMQKKGYTDARLIMRDKLITDINSYIFQKYGIEKLIYAFYSPQFFVDMSIFQKLPKKKQRAISADVKAFLLSQAGIKQVWTYDELRNASGLGQIECYFKKQLFYGRSGYFIVQTFPYNMITKYTTGTSHKTPYEYNTHVPLILYWPDHLTAQVVAQRVWILQLANTLASFLQIQKPSASTAIHLPQSSVI